MKEEKLKIKNRIGELQKELQMHQSRLNQARQVSQTEIEQILAKQGAILEFQKILEDKENDGIEKKSKDRGSGKKRA